MDYQDFKVQWVENKTTKTNKPYKKLSIEDPAGKKFDVNIFSDFPDFANIIPGSVIRGKLEQNGQYWNIISETQSKPRGGASGGFKQAQIEKVMEKKSESIAHFQDKKEESIALAGAQRDAVLIVTTMLAKSDSEWKTAKEVEEQITKWRNWFLSEDFRTPPPF